MNLKETLGEALNPHENKKPTYWLKAEIQGNDLKLMYGRHEVKIDEHSRLALKELIQRQDERE